jgi:hypothetical protein
MYDCYKKKGQEDFHLVKKPANLTGIVNKMFIYRHFF